MVYCTDKYRMHAVGTYFTKAVSTSWGWLTVGWALWTALNMLLSWGRPKCVLAFRPVKTLRPPDNFWKCSSQMYCNKREGFYQRQKDLKILNNAKIFPYFLRWKIGGFHIPQSMSDTCIFLTNIAVLISNCWKNCVMKMSTDTNPFSSTSSTSRMMSRSHSKWRWLPVTHMK